MIPIFEVGMGIRRGEIDFGIITIIPAEYEAVLRRLPEPEPYPTKNQIYQVGSVPCQERAVISARDSGIEVNSAIEMFLTRTARLPGRNRFPPHAGHGTGEVYSLSHSS